MVKLIHTPQSSFEDRNDHTHHNFHLFRYFVEPFRNVNVLGADLYTPAAFCAQPGI